MRNIKNIFSLIFALSVFTELINCDCILSIGNSLQNRPVVKRQIGSNTLINPKTEQFEIFDGEHLSAQCATRFSQNIFHNNDEDTTEYNFHCICNERNIKYDDIVRDLTLECYFDELYIKPSNGRKYTLKENTLTCEDFDWQVFESKEPWPWCSYQSNSYILATNFDRTEIVGALCFNLNDMRLESVNYATNGGNFTLTQDEQYILPPNGVNDELIGSKLNYLNQISSSYDKSLDLMEVLVYKEDTILQTKVNSAIFRNYQNLLKVPWWHNLKYGNWKRFMRAFDERSAKLTYNVFMGSSGILKLPQPEFFDGKEMDETKVVNYNEAIPAYIWAYLQAFDKSEEFVFISYNSPFYELFFNSTEIIFCEDICHEISWLSKIRSTFSHSTLGVSFCCSPESVHYSRVLNGFPCPEQLSQSKKEKNPF